MAGHQQTRTTMTRKKLIEVALPLEAINSESLREGYIYKGNPSSVHKWWAQRPLAAARAVIFSSLVDDPLEQGAPERYVQACANLPKGKNSNIEDNARQRLFDFIEELIQWENKDDVTIINTAKRLISLSNDGVIPTLLDPFAGGGTIPIEGQRLGLLSVAGDLNPVAVLINKSLIEIPALFNKQAPVNPEQRNRLGNDAQWAATTGLATDIRYYGAMLKSEAQNQMQGQYPSGPNGEVTIAWLWTRTVICPNPACGANVPLIKSYEIGTKKSNRHYVSPDIDIEGKTVGFIVHEGKLKEKYPSITRSGSVCLVCNTPVPLEHVREQAQSSKLTPQMLAIVTDGVSGRKYHTPDQTHITAAHSASPNWGPSARLEGKAAISVPLYGLETYEDLFTRRQLAALNTFCDLLDQIEETAFDDAIKAGLNDDRVPLHADGTGATAYAQAIRVYLSFAIDKYASYGCSLAVWYSSEDRPKALFARQAVPMVWDFVEVNPFTDIGGSFIRSVEIVADSIEPLDAELQGNAFQADAAAFEFGITNGMISTDPPYYSNINYADLSDFFYVWLRRNLSIVYPDIFGTMLVPKQQEIVASPYLFNNDQNLANNHFEGRLKQAFSKFEEIISDEFPLTVYYAFKQSEIAVDSNDGNKSVSSTGWETMLDALIHTGFLINGTWPMRTERGGRMVSVGTNALASSIVLVCRLRPADASMTSRRDFVNALRRELPYALREMQSGNIAPVDLAQASIGPGMAVYSRYSAVLEADGSPMSVRTALQIINQELDAFLAETEGDIDQDSRFAVNWFEQFGFQQGEFGQADVLARAKNTSVDGLVHAGVLESGAGKVRLYLPSELDPGWDPSTDKRLTVWEATHHLIAELDQRGEAGAAQLLAKMSPELAVNARQLAYRLYNICERKDRAEAARDYNALVISWPAIQERASQIRDEGAGQMSMDL